MTENDIPWAFIQSYFTGSSAIPSARAIKHQLESYNDFIDFQLMKTINMFNKHEPIVSEKEYNETYNKNPIEIYITFKNFQMESPQTYKMNGTKKDMFPHEARLRNMIYSSAMFLDVHIQTIVYTGEALENREIHNTILPKVPIGKMPIMVKSNICMLTKYSHIDPALLGECKYDAGGYFIINGSEKVIITQERAAENKICVYPVKNSSKYILQAELKSVPEFKCISPKQINMMLCAKNNGFGHPIVIQLPRTKQQSPIPIFIVFRALGVLSDKDICNCILLNIDAVKQSYKSELLDALKASIIDSRACMTEEDSLQYIINLVSYTATAANATKNAADKQKNKRAFALDILANDLFPHCSTKTQKIYYLGYMAYKLLMVSLGYEQPSDRDSYFNKRLDLPGMLLNNLFRTHFNKFVKDMEHLIIKEIDTGSWRTKGGCDYGNIINKINCHKIFKTTTIESNIKRALSTGDFSVKYSSSNKVGVAQVLNRLNYISYLSHMRRISTPYNKSDKLIPPRKLHCTSYGIICPAETPEGQSVGVVKNMAYLATATIPTDPSAIHAFLREIADKPCYYTPTEIGRTNTGTPYCYHPLTTFDERGNECTLTAIPTTLYDKVKVFVNGAWVGTVENPVDFYAELKDKKMSGIFNIYTSIVFNISVKEITICTDAGRLLQPLLRINLATQQPYFNTAIINALNDGTITWDDLLISHGDLGNHVLSNVPAVIEYVDVEEFNTTACVNSLAKLRENIAYTKPDGTACTYNGYRYTHCDVHSSYTYGVTAACIPFPDMNQSPRNAYQSAQAKQAAGTYITNYYERMDKTAYTLMTPQRPLVETRVMNILRLHEIPWGANINVAIMTYTGYNQEDSIIMKRSFAERGGLNIFTYHTEKDEDKQKTNGDEEIRCKPNPAITKKMKFGDYSKLNQYGFMPENTLVKNKDIIIAKVTPIKSNRNKNDEKIKYEDQSKMYRTAEETFIDKNYVDKNGDGYTFAKVRVRTLRQPCIGDKFSSRSGQKGTVGLILDDVDMPFTADGITPDIIINPHAIPSRMTIAQLMETLLSGVLAELGRFGDGTPYGDLKVTDVSEILHKLGKESNGDHLLYNPLTGEQLTCYTFMGHVFYHRLKHMVNDKVHSRAKGLDVNLTRQPMEGRAREGGLRLGEMERDATIAHGMAAFTRERLYQSSDAYHVYVCKACGMRAIYNDKARIHECRVCDNTSQFRRVEIPYACKLLDQELQAMNISMRYITDR